MATLEHKENEQIQDFLDAYKRELAPVEITVSHDLHVWKALLKTAEATHPLSTPFDPDLNDIRPSEGFWLALRYNGEDIACVGARVLRADTDFVREWITTYRIFDNRSPRMISEPYELTSNIPRIRGFVGYGGGSWVHPKWRGMGIANITSRLAKVIALRHWRLDFYTAMIKDTRQAWASDGLGWPNSELLTTGHHPGRKDFICDVRLHWMNTDDIMNVARDLEFIGSSAKRVRSRLATLVPSGELSGDIDALSAQYLEQ